MTKGTFFAKVCLVNQATSQYVDGSLALKDLQGREHSDVAFIEIDERTIPTNSSLIKAVAELFVPPVSEMIAKAKQISRSSENDKDKGVVMTYVFEIDIDQLESKRTLPTKHQDLIEKLQWRMSLGDDWDELMGRASDKTIYQKAIDFLNLPEVSGFEIPVFVPLSTGRLVFLWKFKKTYIEMAFESNRIDVHISTPQFAGHDQSGGQTFRQTSFNKVVAYNHSAILSFVKEHLKNVPKTVKHTFITQPVKEEKPIQEELF